MCALVFAVAIICGRGPAGWGKTVLLTQWQASDAATRSFAWVQLDARDDDQVRLWSQVIGALRTIQPNVGRESLAALPVAGQGLIDAVLAPLLSELAA
jgi:ATP/maltotriose-dependent transcriptional regulator MalT